MNRRLFLQNIGLAGAGVAFAPLIPAVASSPTRTIYKVSMPVFKFWYWKRDNNGKMLWESRISTVRSFKGTLKLLLDRHPDDEIFFYEESTTEFIPGHKVNIVRASIVAKEPGVTISSTSDIHTTII
jgi:hypothetical protein